MASLSSQTETAVDVNGSCECPK